MGKRDVNSYDTPLKELAKVNSILRVPMWLIPACRSRALEPMINMQGTCVSACKQVERGRPREIPNLDASNNKCHTRVSGQRLPKILTWKFSNRNAYPSSWHTHKKKNYFCVNGHNISGEIRRKAEVEWTNMFLGLLMQLLLLTLISVSFFIKLLSDTDRVIV